MRPKKWNGQKLRKMIRLNPKNCMKLDKRRLLNLKASFLICKKSLHRLRRLMKRRELQISKNSSVFLKRSKQPGRKRLPRFAMTLRSSLPSTKTCRTSTIARLLSSSLK